VSDVIGRGVIEVSADATKLRAGIDEAKKSVASLGIASEEATKRQSASIDKYIKQLGTAAVTTGKSTRETELYKLGLRGASDAQLAAANSALKLTEGYEKGQILGGQIKAGFVALAAVSATALIATYAAFDQLVKKAAEFQDLSETTGASAEGLASIAVAAATAGVSMDSVASATIKLTKNLTGVDDEGKAVGAALASIGINISDFKKLDPVGQFDAVGKALSGFADGAGKTAVAVALYGKAGAEQLKVFKAVEDAGGRQVILTAEQIRMADAYADAQSKAKEQLLMYASALATSALGAQTAFTEALGDAIKELAGVGKESTALGLNAGVKAFSEGAAIALAEMVDVGYNAVGMMLAVKGSLNVMLADTKVAGDFATKAFGSFLPGDVYREQTADLAAAAKDREKVLKDANAAYERLATGFGLADKVRGRIANAPFADPRILGNPGTIAQQVAGQVDYKGVTTPKTGGTTGKDPDADFRAYLKNLQNQISKTNELNAAEKLLADIRSGNLTVGAAQEVRLMTLAKEVDATKDAFAIANERAARRRKDDQDSIQGIRDIEAAKRDAIVRNAADVENIRTGLLTDAQAENEAYAQRLATLQTFHDTRVENEASANALIEAEGLRHRQSMAATQAAYDVQSVQMMGDAAGALYGVMEKAGKEQTALGKTLFLAQKALAVAEIIMNTNVAAAKVMGQTGIFGFPLAAVVTATGYAQAAIVAGTAIASLDKGTDFVPRDMVAQIHKGEAIIPAAQNRAGGGDMRLTIVNNTSAKIGKVTEQRLPTGERALIIEEAVAATAAHLSDPNSKTSRAMSRNFALQRSR
jgi:hypothetical protein